MTNDQMMQLPPAGEADQIRLATEMAFAISTLPFDKWDAAIKRGLAAYRESMERHYGECLSSLQADRSTLHLHLAVLHRLRKHVTAPQTMVGHA